MCAPPGVSRSAWVRGTGGLVTLRPQGGPQPRAEPRLAFVSEPVVSQLRCFDCQDSRHIVKTCFINDPPARSGRRAAFVLGQSKCLRARFDFSRGLVYGSASDRLRARGLFESFATGSAEEPRLTEPGCWQLALAVSSPPSHCHVALEELIIPRCSGLPSYHLG